MNIEKLKEEQIKLARKVSLKDNFKLITKEKAKPIYTQ